jgi:hypothetical protein
MKLSLKKKLGWTHVRGGRLVRVAKPHPVPTAGWSPYALEYKNDLLGRPKPAARFAEGEKWVFTKEGDLAVEILAVDSSASLGFSYISGPAIQLNRYREADSGFFDAALGKIIAIPDPSMAKFTREEFAERVVTAIVGAKYGNEAINAFEYQARDDAEAQLVARKIAEVWYSYVSTDRDTAQRAHLLGVIHGRKSHINVHFQPPDAASEFAATPFQVGLVMSTLRGSNR